MSQKFSTRLDDTLFADEFVARSNAADSVVTQGGPKGLV
jgi:hypothetical protein